MAGRISRLFTGVAVVALSLSAVVGASASVRSGARAPVGEASVAVAGWGSVKISEGHAASHTVRCPARCTSAYGIQGPRLVLRAAPWDGWKFAGWHGACKGTSPRCVIEVSRLHPNAYGKRNASVGARFVAVGPGWTPGNPVPLGTTESIGNGYRVRINSVIPNIQLSPAAPAGQAYFAADVTLSYTGPGQGDVDSIVWTAFTSTGGYSTSGWAYDVTAAGEPPAPAPQPPLDYTHPLYPGHSTTGYICWTVDATDAATLNRVSVGSSSPPLRRALFALR